MIITKIASAIIATIYDGFVAIVEYKMEIVVHCEIWICFIIFVAVWLFPTKFSLCHCFWFENFEASSMHLCVHFFQIFRKFLMKMGCTIKKLLFIWLFFNISDEVNSIHKCVVWSDAVILFSRRWDGETMG